MARVTTKGVVRPVFILAPLNQGIFIDERGTKYRGPKGQDGG